MEKDNYLKELLDKYELDELLDLFLGVGYTVNDFVERHRDYLQKIYLEEDSDR